MLNKCVRCLRPSLQSQGTTTTHTPSRLSVSATPRSKAKHVLVRQRLSPEARCQVAASCRQWQGRTGACRAPLRAVSRSVGASSLRRDDAEGCCTRDRERAREEERERERWFGLTPCDATNKEGGRERVVWHLVTASRLETAETCQPAANERCELDTCQRSRELRRWQAKGDGRCRRGLPLRRGG